MTGDVVVTKKTFAEVASRVKIIVDWTSDPSTGAVASDPIDAIGFVTEIEYIGGALGDKVTDTPTAGYNVYIVDPYGFNLIDKAGDGGATSAKRALQETPLWVDDYMIVSITAAGNSKKGRLIIWIDRTTS